MPRFYFHISRAARARYNVDESLFSLRGNVVFANFYSARLLAQQINAARSNDGAVQAGELNALGLIHEIFHALLQQYRQQRGEVMAQAVSALYENVGRDAVETTMEQFIDMFPPLPVYRGQQTVGQYLNETTDGIRNREIVLEEMILVWMQNQNPAASPFKELFDDTALAQTTAYTRIVTSLRGFFADREPLGVTGQTLFDALLAPFTISPDSLSAQLDYMLYRWSAAAERLDMTRFFSRVVGGLQLIQEEQKYLWTQAHAPFGGGGGGGFTATTPPVPTFPREMVMRLDERGNVVWVEAAVEPEQFSPDLDWMPNLVLIAKSTYVWLDQLSKKYQREIRRLDQIPDEELDELRARGIKGLWLIGVWERSGASARIKQMMGNTNAIASAYSLYDYQIANDLGGPEALQNLKERAWKRGVRLASDMVPNHMGIDSRWVVEHPDWFIQDKAPPYPAYTFQSPDLSSDPRVTIQIEDHYFDKTDAAVVFKRTDNETGDARYIYHGNDGTSFPWNDTAQLDYLQPKVREGVIQTILHVARQFPVIRFDAAMTLAKKHFERLWYPVPGTTDSIPSRPEYAMTKADFDAAMPEEFWREVVDRVAEQAPDTLLLAEAFWLMEGYFVRTLGMHRVYNSAFMHMMRDEKNQEYRLVIKNTIEFDPEVLKRYVNFMNNPDERTAQDQFGKGDKYFGVAVLMSTLPGLPMFGHGQIEGFTERYGMEFQRAMLDETPDARLIERHEREIFPLLHKRYLFAGVENFMLYDVYRADGAVEENVFAYSNRAGNEGSLVAYNNSYTEARGTLCVSAASRDKSRDELVQRTLAEGLKVRDEDNSFVIFREAVSNNEFIRPTRGFVQNGFEISLGAYKYAVYLEFRQVQDTPEGAYANLHDRLHGHGVPSIEQALRDIQLAPLHAAFRDLMNAETLRGTPEEQHVKELKEKAVGFAQIAREFGVARVDEKAFAERVTKNLETVGQMANLVRNKFVLQRNGSKKLNAATDDLNRQMDDSTRAGLAAFAIVQALEEMATDDPDAPRLGTVRGTRGARVAAWIDEWQLGGPVGDALRGAGVSDERIRQLLGLMKIALQNPKVDSPETLVNEPSVSQFLNVNTFDNVTWFNKEQFGALTNWLYVIGAFQSLGANGKQANAALLKQHAQWSAWRDAEAKSGYRLEKLIIARSPRRTRGFKKQTRGAQTVTRGAAPQAGKVTDAAEPSAATEPAQGTVSRETLEAQLKTAKGATGKQAPKTAPKTSPKQSASQSDAPKKQARPRAAKKQTKPPAADS